MEIYLSAAGRSAVEKAPQKYLERARQGAAVVLADLRFSGDYAAARLAGQGGDANSLAVAWDRNGALWGRPVAGLMTTDLQSVIDYLARERDMNAIAVQVTAKDDAPLALAALLAACLDPRITALDADFVGRSFATSAPQRSSCQDLPLICNILQYGDIPQWAATPGRSSRYPAACSSVRRHSPLAERYLHKARNRTKSATLRLRTDMTPRERVLAALSHTQPDYTPCDYYATPEIHVALARHFGLGTPRSIAGSLGGSAAAMEDGGVAERLGTDIRYVNPPYIGPPLPTFDDGRR